MELISEVQVHGLASACTSGVQTTAQNLFLTGSKLLIFSPFSFIQWYSENSDCGGYLHESLPVCCRLRACRVEQEVCYCQQSLPGPLGTGLPKEGEIPP